ncbi:hypothetical protein LSAT2_016499 [Lamellibrachia satsuma]|nr:hypothetical protein LSAT2_016499 [Lamellibrachia satsuma]
MNDANLGGSDQVTITIARYSDLAPFLGVRDVINAFRRTLKCLVVCTNFYRSQVSSNTRLAAVLESEMASRRPPRKSSPLRSKPIAINASSSTSSQEEEVPDGKNDSLLSNQLGAGEQGAVTKSEEMLFPSSNMAKLMYMDEIPSDSSLISPAPIALKAGHSGDCLPEQQQQSHLDIVNPKKRLENAALDFTDDAKEKYHVISTAFDKEYLKNFYHGFNTLYSIWMTICESKNKSSRIMPGNVLDRMNKMMTENWSKVEDNYINDPFFAYRKNWNAKQSLLPAELILQLISRMDVIEHGLMNKLKEYDSATNETMNKLNEKVDILSDQKKDLGLRLQKRTMEVTQTNSEAAALRGTIELLQRRIDVKSVEIAQLRKGGTVQLWEKEKKKLMETSLQREEEMRERIVELEEDKEHLMARIKRVDEKYRVQKMKNELRVSEDQDEEVERNKKYIFMLEQDMHRLGVELRHQQRHVAGIFMGLMTDLGAGLKFLQEKASIAPEALEKVSIPLEYTVRAYEAAKLGKLAILRADLPLQYLATPEECKTMSDIQVKLLSTAYAKKITDDNNSMISHSSRKKNKEKRVARKAEDESSSSLHKKANHPPLIKPETGQVDVAEARKHFPDFSEADIRDQFEYFTGYDQNKDGKLDLGEAMTAMTTTTGSKFSASQMKEAVAEVDLDGSGAIDFYEYLNMARMLLNVEGRAQIFRSKLVEQHGKQVSKMCNVM